MSSLVTARSQTTSVHVNVNGQPGYDTTIGKTASDARETKWRIDRPNVNQESTVYRQVLIGSDDTVQIRAGGGVQTGGDGRTWKLYVNPQGPKSDRLYHGTIRMYGLSYDSRRLCDFGLGDRHHLPAVVGGIRFPLILGYEDDGYSDNGYWGHDDGFGSQCRGVGPAWVEISVLHGSRPNPSVPEALVRRHAPLVSFHPHEGGQCCYPSDAETAYDLIKRGTFEKDKRPTTLDPNAPCYFQYSEEETSIDGQAPQRKQLVQRLKYWFWYNYNDFASGPDPYGSHEGDWESVEVELLDGAARQYRLSNHERRLSLSARDVALEGGRIKVWVANGSHANYPSPRYKPYAFMGFADELEDGGSVWDARAHLTPLVDTTFGRDLYSGRFGLHNVVAPEFVGDPPVSPVVRQFES